MFGLGDEIGGGKIGAVGVVGHDHHLAGAGNRVDIDLPKHVLLGQGHEQVAWTDDLVNRADSLDAIGQRGHGLGAAGRYTSSMPNSWQVASRSAL